jgi:hypothetical protein
MGGFSTIGDSFKPTIGANSLYATLHVRHVVANAVAFLALNDVYFVLLG